MSNQQREEEQIIRRELQRLELEANLAGNNFSVRKYIEIRERELAEKS